MKAKNALENEIVQLEAKCRQLDEGIVKSREYVERAKEELKLYVSGVSHSQAEREKSVRDQLQHKIVEQEKLNAQLRQEQRQIKENLPHLEQQMVHWAKIEKYKSLFLIYAIKLSKLISHFI